MKGVLTCAPAEAPLAEVPPTAPAPGEHTSQPTCACVYLRAARLMCAYPP